MKTFLYVKANGSEEKGQQKMELLREQAKITMDEIFAERINMDQEPLFLENGRCILLEVMKVLQIEKLFVLHSYDLSLNREELIEFNYRLYQENILCELVMEKQTLSQWVIDQKMMRA